ncbi:MAG: helix-turn-helix domain-containing protein [Candidatus Binatia bacterium]
MMEAPAPRPRLRPARTPRRRPARPKRGPAAETRARLIEAAAAVFNRAGYHGTDSNRLARAAGYAPATFYKHFPDKRTILLAAYEDWVTAEWHAIGTTLVDPASAAERAERIVAFVLEHHRRWKGLRASLRALVATDAVVRRFHRAQRRRQLELLARMRGGRARDEAATRDEASARVDDAIMLFTLERTLDAVAEGETADLGLDEDAVITRLRAVVRAAVDRPAATRG